ncbi:MAG: hypothetical protein IKB38_01375 [Clostridia bacterium]|nr:hypothetical protein [Clostridia bacterium]
MGFGTLFIGYVLLLDLPYQTLTNAIAAGVMLIALLKLAYLNSHMKRALYACSFFFAFAIYEAVIEVLSSVFFISVGGIVLNTASYLIRNVLIGALSVFMLFGMRDVAEEVGLRRLAKKCDIYSKLTLSVYVLNLTVPPDLAVIFGGTGSAVYTQFLLSVVTTLFTLYIIVMNCINIYSCYSKICMPEDNVRAGTEKKPSRFGFVNKFREHEDEKRREYAEYRYGKMRERKKKREDKKK